MSRLLAQVSQSIPVVNHIGVNCISLQCLINGIYGCFLKIRKICSEAEESTAFLKLPWRNQAEELYNVNSSDPVRAKSCYQALQTLTNLATLLA